MILKCPDFFFAACLLRKENCYHGKGVFSAVIQMLGEKRDPSFKDLARKLAMLKHGFIPSSKHKWVSEAENGELNFDGALVPESERAKVFADSKIDYIKHQINYKKVFQIWKE
mmetsp:Transcript_4503/g.7670  ORF Transcript_4503/g.7670 Transcript_4503/m.7670 type:complete len:113 (-) Transcript_4503:294-632(-)